MPNWNDLNPAGTYPRIEPRKPEAPVPQSAIHQIINAPAGMQVGNVIVTTESIDAEFIPQSPPSETESYMWGNPDDWADVTADC